MVKLNGLSWLRIRKYYATIYPQEENCSVITAITSVFTHQRCWASKNINFNKFFIRKQIKNINLKKVMLF
jgi:hypothetical protein